MSTWIFLRGLTRESRHWGDFQAIFRAAIHDCDIVTLDLPGNGILNGQRSPTSVAAMAEHCRAELLAREIRPPYYLLAMSLGAMVAVNWADSHPQELAGCVCINTSLRPYNPFYQRLRPRNYAALLRLALPCGGAAVREQIVLRMTCNMAGPHAKVLEAWNAWRNERPVTPANALRQLWAAIRYQAPQRKPAVPLLILASTADQLVNPCCSRRLAHRWQTAYAEHPHAGHDLPLDDGTWVAQQVNEWLRVMNTRSPQRGAPRAL